MTRFIGISALFLSLAPNLAFSDTAKITTAKCTITYKLEDKKTGEEKEVTEWIKLRINASGEIEPWNKKKWADVNKGAYWLNVFSEDSDTYGFEWEKTFKAGNGYSILELGTTADVFKFGVNAAKGKGFFEYIDIGSGNGNKGPIDAKCEVQKA